MVKNVAGLDMGKLMIGSFGTLAVMTSVNFRVHSLPEMTETFLFSAPQLPQILEKRKALLLSPLKPTAVDVLSENMGVNAGFKGWLLAVRAGGTRAVLHRYQRELTGADVLKGADETAFWKQVTEATPDFLKQQAEGVVLRVGTRLTDTEPLLEMLSVPCVSRAASGTTYVYCNSWHEALPLWKAAKERGWGAVVEFAPDHIRLQQELWPPEPHAAANGFTMMNRVKRMFDPDNLLNRSRLYGRI